MRFYRQITVLLLLIAVGVFPVGLMGVTPHDNEMKAVRALVEELADNLEKGTLNVTIGSLTLENSKISSEFAENLLTLAQAEMSQPDYSEDFVQVKRQILTRSASKTRSGLIREQGNDVPGETAVTLSGVYRQSPDESIIYVTLRLEEDNGARVSQAEIAIKRDAVRLPIKPANITKMEKITDDIDRLSTPSNDFQIDLWIDKGNGGVYRSGDNLKVMFRTEVDCFLRVIYIDVDGNRILMYPTERDPKGKLRAGVVYELHRNNRYTIQPPFGTEMIIAFASTHMFTDEGLINVGGGYRAFSGDRATANIVSNLRGIKIAKKGGSAQGKALKSEARITLTTMP